MRILIVGAGSVGGYFGGRLAAAGRDVTFLVRAARGEQLRRDGLRVLSPAGDINLAPQMVLAAGISGPYDLVLLSVKSYGLDAAIADFAPAVSSQTMILPLLNGIRHLDILRARFDPECILGGSTRISTDLDGAGQILHISKFNDLRFGEHNGGVTDRMLELQETLSNAGFDAMLEPNIIRVMWEKWVMLASSAVITCLLRGSIGDVMAIAGGRETALAIIAECSAIAAAEGHAISDAALEFTRNRLTESGSSFTASMYRDLQKAAPVEVDHVLGDLLQRGALHSVETPLLRAACVQLGAYENRLARN